ncbi:hypothetical protein NUM3379_26070 [Kineococcus sp. NUM-3379]
MADRLTGVANRLTVACRTPYCSGGMADDERRGRAAVVAARLLAALTTAAVLVAVALPPLTGGGWLPALFRTPEPVVGPSFAVAGALLVGLRPARRLGWLLLLVGVSAGAYVLATSVAYRVGEAGTAGWFRGWLWVPALFLVTAVLPQVLPHGRPLPGWWRWPAAAGIALTVVATALPVLPAGARDPLAVPWVALALAALIACGAASLVVRVRRADGVRRRQLAWPGYGLAVLVAATFLAPPWAVALAVLLVPAGLAVAAFRYRLYDIDAVVERTLVVTVLFGLSALVYAAVVGWSGALLGERRGAAPFLAAFAAALAFSPAQARVKRVVSRLVHGEGSDPYAFLTRLDAALRDAASPREALRAGVAAVASGLRLPAAAVEVPVPGASPVREEVGDVPADAEAIPLVLHGEEVGTLRVVPRGGERVLHPAGRRLLADVGNRIAAAAYAVRLARDVEASRERLLTAREEERRRLRRDLHDGLGPQMSAVVMTLDTAGSALRRGDPGRAGALVAAAGAQAAEAVVDVRRLVHGLRPPALDDLGLLGALRAGAAALAQGGPVVDVEGTGRTEDLPAALEVAVLRIAQEAVLNAVRHAGAGRVLVSVRAGEDVVELEVADDGAGLPGDRTAGVGLASMRERAAELGGTCRIEPRVPRGTRVHAVLPREVGA